MSKDLFIIREYEIDGIKVLLKIDVVKAEISLVDFSYRKHEYSNKQWLFADRSIGYARTWLRILNAMIETVKSGIEELELIEEEKTRQLASAMMQMEENKKNDKVSH